MGGLSSLPSAERIVMSRVAQAISTKLLLVPAVLAAVVGGGIWWHEAQTDQVRTVVNAEQQLTEISYHGRAGATALKLLKEHATVTTKHYSFGDMVLSIDGVQGSGPKYWTFYVNNKEAPVGAGAYATKNGDQITWKLQ
jgi:hypothetical protein